MAGWIQFCGTQLGRLVHTLNPRARETALLNLQKALPHLEHPQFVIRRCFEHFATCLLESLLIPFRSPSFWQLEFDGLPLYQEAIQHHRGVILLSAHMGNWEYVGTLAQKGPPIYGLYREQKQLGSLIRYLRSKTGMRPLNVKKSLKSAIQALKAGKVLGIVGDQFREREFLFFNHPTHFPLGAARLAAQTGCPIALALCLRQPDGSLKVQIDEIIYPPQDASKIASMEWIMQKYIQWLQNHILRNPHQYLWMRDFWQLHRQKKGRQA